MNVWGSLEETELGDPQWIRRALTVSRGAPLFHGIRVDFQRTELGAQIRDCFQECR